MKKLFTVSILIFLTLVVAFTTPMLLKDPGYAYMRFGGYEIEMRFIVALGILVAFIILFWLVVYLLRLPKKTSDAISKNRARKSFAKGLLALSEGHFKEAEKLLISSTKNSLTPELSYMAAARAAVSQNKIDAAFEYLNLAENATDNPLTVDLTRCELWVKLGNDKKAIDLLNRVLKSYPNNPRALFLMTQAAGNIGDWPSLRNVIPKAAKLELLPDDQLIKISNVSIQSYLNTSQSSQMLSENWNNLAKADRQNLGNLIAFAKCANDLLAAKIAQKDVENYLNRSMDNRLLELWLEFDLEASNKQKTAEKWLKSHPVNPVLLRICGQLCMEQKLWGKAQSYLQKSLEIDPSQKTYALLGDYFDSIHESENALEAYRLSGQSKNKLELLPK